MKHFKKEQVVCNELMMSTIKMWSHATKSALNYEIGKLLLEGLGVVDMPNSKVGIESRLAKRNEGNTSVRLNGDADRVHSISVRKFYPHGNHQSIIRVQSQAGSAISLIADHCEFDEYGANERKKPRSGQS